jgi:hypothetical protein
MANHQAVSRAFSSRRTSQLGDATQHLCSWIPAQCLTPATRRTACQKQQIQQSATGAGQRIQQKRYRSPPSYIAFGARVIDARFPQRQGW